MDAKPTYTKFHNFYQGCLAYAVEHPLFTETKMYVETRRSGNIWIAYETYDEQTAQAGKSPDEAVAKMLKVAKDALRKTKAQNFWYSEEERLTSGSTAWHALYSGRENADDTVAEGNVTDDSAEYWELALSGYNSLMDELEGRDRKLAETHNLIDLPVCHWCEQHTLEASPINSDEVFCPECLPLVTLCHEFDGLDEEEQESKDAKRAASEYADEKVPEGLSLAWLQVALAQYTALTGEATSVTEKQPEAVAEAKADIRTLAAAAAALPEYSREREQALLKVRNAFEDSGVAKVWSYVYASKSVEDAARTLVNNAEVAQKQVEAPEGLELFVGEDEHHQVHVRIVGQNVGYAWLRAAAAAKKWTGGCKIQQVSAASTKDELRFIFRYEI